MRINGKSLGDIWQEMTMPYRIVVAVGVAFLFFSTFYLLISFGSGVNKAFDGEAGPLMIIGAPQTNHLDPSLASDGQTVALAFTSALPTNVSVGVATGNNACSRLRYVSAVFTDKPEGLLAPDGKTTLAQGTTRYETPSVVYDPTDTATPWKIFAYRYFWMNNIAYAQRYSMIVMRSAPAPEGPWGSEVWLLASAPDHPPPPYQNLIGTFINTLSPDLATVSGYARPSVVAYRGVLLMSLITLLPSGEPDRVILLSSLDRGNTWGYAGTLLSPEQRAAAVPNMTRLSGASLIIRGSQLYLAATLGNSATAAAGTWLFSIADPTAARLASTPKGAPAIARHLPLQSGEPTTRGGGFAAYTAACDADGIITSEHSGIRGTYTLFRTLVRPPAK